MNSQTTALAIPQPQRITDTILISEGKGLMPTNFTGLWEMAQIFAVSGMMPRDLQNKPEAVFVAINMGYELGLSPLSAIQNISVINGRPTVWGDAMLAIVRASGKLSKFKEYFTGTWANDDFTAVCECSRGNESAVEQFSIADAKTAKLWAYPSQGMTPWHKYPKRMLQMRARSWALRNMFSDVLKGISATEELTEYDIEVSQQPDGSYSAVPQTEKKQRKTTKKQEQQPVQQVAVSTPFEQFYKLVQEKGTYPEEIVESYIKEISASKKVSADHIVNVAVKNFNRFWDSLSIWVESHAETEQQEAETETQQAISSPKLESIIKQFPDEYALACNQLGIDEPKNDEDIASLIRQVNNIVDSYIHSEGLEEEEAD